MLTHNLADGTWVQPSRRTKPDAGQRAATYPHDGSLESQCPAPGLSASLTNAPDVRFERETPRGSATSTYDSRRASSAAIH